MSTALGYRAVAEVKAGIFNHFHLTGQKRLDLLRPMLEDFSVRHGTIAPVSCFFGPEFLVTGTR